MADEWQQSITKPVACEICKESNTNVAALMTSCSECGLMLCLKHRAPNKHDCKGLNQLREKQEERSKGSQKSKDAIHEAQRQIRRQQRLQWQQNSTQAARMVALMQLKRVAKGDGVTPQERRFYVRVHLPRSEVMQPLTIPVFLDTLWPIGRCIDKVASAAQLPVQSNNKRLFLFRLSTGIILWPLDCLLKDVSWTPPWQVGIDRLVLTWNTEADVHSSINSPTETDASSCATEESWCQVQRNNDPSNQGTAFIHLAGLTIQPDLYASDSDGS